MIIAKILWTLFCLFGIYLYCDLFITELWKARKLNKLKYGIWYIGIFLVCFVIGYAIVSIVSCWRL